MANQLGMAEQHSIITLWRRGWSHRRIARTLGIHRETVSRYVRLASRRTEDAHAPPASTEGKPGSRVGDAKPAIPITGSEPTSRSDSTNRCAGGAAERDRPKPAILIAGFSGRQSQCEPYRKVILGCPINNLDQSLPDRWKTARTPKTCKTTPPAQQ